MYFYIRYVSKIAKVDHKKKKILIHFEGWNSRYDEWVSFDSKKIRPLPKEKVKSKSKTKEFKVSDLRLVWVLSCFPL